MRFLIIICIIVLTVVSCKKEEIETPEEIGFCEVLPVGHISCGPEIIRDSLMFDSILSTFFTLSNVDISEDCLSFELTASGCDGNSWLVNLVEAQTIAYTNPITKELKVDFYNNEICAAVFTNHYYFDLLLLQENTDSVINLNIVNAGISILYSY